MLYKIIILTIIIIGLFFFVIIKKCEHDHIKQRKIDFDNIFRKWAAKDKELMDKLYPGYTITTQEYNRINQEIIDNDKMIEDYVKYKL